MKRSFVVAVALLFVCVAAQPLAAQAQGNWVNTNNMNSVREADVQVTLANGKALVTGGTDGTNYLSSAEIYDPSKGTWTLTGSLATGRESFAGVLLKNGNVLVVGGLGGSGVILASAELYNPSTGKWSSAGALSVSRYAHTATLLQSGKVLVTGGYGGSSPAYLTDSELYDPSSNRWTTTGSMNTARSTHTATLLKSGEVLVAGGKDGAPLNSSELYNPSTGKWIFGPNMTTARFLHAATLMKSGKVLVTGGTVSRFPISTAEIYDPTANTWTLTGSMKSGHYAHTATLLPDTSVLVAGGEGQLISCGKACSTAIPTAKSEFYVESTGQFTLTSSLPRALAYQSASVLGNGQTLASGGSGTTAYCCVVVSNAELYTPLTFTFSATSLSFGQQEVGTTSQAQIVTVTNASFHSATFSSIAASGDYSESNNCPNSPTPLNAGQSCTITVTFKPSTTGARNGAVTLKDNAPASPQQTISLSGTGEPYAFAVSPSSITFPSVLPGSSSGPVAVTLLADGATPVTVSSISIAPPDGTFTQTNNCPAMLMPGQSCTINVVFTPPDSVSFMATLSVTDSSNQTQTVTLMGTGID